jgi:hypothetical protein
VGPPAMENTPAGRVLTLLEWENAPNKFAEKGALQVANAPPGKEGVSLPSIANGLLARSSFRLIFFKEIGEITHECHECHHSRPSKPDEEQYFQKQYQIMQHDLGYSTTSQITR